MFFVSKGNLFLRLFYYTAAGVSAVPAVERLPVYHNSADYISNPLGSLGHCGIFENGVLLMYTLEGLSSVANFFTAHEESR